MWFPPGRWAIVQPRRNPKAKQRVRHNNDVQMTAYLERGQVIEIENIDGLSSCKGVVRPLDECAHLTHNNPGNGTVNLCAQARIRKSNFLFRSLIINQQYAITKRGKTKVFAAFLLSKLKIP